MAAKFSRRPGGASVRGELATSGRGPDLAWTRDRLTKDPAARPEGVKAWADAVAALLELVAADEPGWPEPLSGPNPSRTGPDEAPTGSVMVSTTAGDRTRG
jgi:hypothetical protein